MSSIIGKFRRCSTISQYLRYVFNPFRYNHLSVLTKAITAHQNSQCVVKCRWTTNNSGNAPQSQSEIGLDGATYDRICSETLDSLCEYIEELTEQSAITGADVAYSDGVLTIALGDKYGTYVINRQTPNKQIWLSSPQSGPKRYDLIMDTGHGGGKWLYKHTGESLHSLLQRELQQIFISQSVNFSKLPYSK